MGRSRNKESRALTFDVDVFLCRSMLDMKFISLTIDLTKHGRGSYLYCIRGVRKIRQYNQMIIWVTAMEDVKKEMKCNMRESTVILSVVINKRKKKKRAT